MATIVERKIRVEGGSGERFDEVLTAEALDFLEDLHHHFDQARRGLLTVREERLADFALGALPGFPEGMVEAREGDWRVPAPPPDLLDRRVEITGPVDRKMVINGLNSGARVYMADFEDANAPTWESCVAGQVNLKDAVRREIELRSGEKQYALNRQVATLLVRPRGWHLDERHVFVGERPMSASLFDFGLYFFHNAAELVSRGSGPYFYLPKLESHREAALWNQVFARAERNLGLRAGAVRATVLIETILAAFEMEEILYELRERSAGFNAGRWDYIFSLIKNLRWHEWAVLPDRGQVTMTVPFMHAYTERLVEICHRRGAHAIGGMAAFIPNRREPEVTERAIAKVREDKEREAAQGFDGTWVAHPDLVPVAMEVFDRHLGDMPNQIARRRDDVRVTAAELLDLRVPGGEITEAGVRQNVSVALQYLDAWLAGTGAAAIANLMEDTATAEISRAQLWQWRHHGARLADGRVVDEALYGTIREEELRSLGGRGERHLAAAAEILDELVLAEEFVPFLTLVAYPRLVGR
ncbi:MAG TPA: malate synthase A [Thermoanaerobaculia bacterium]|nr:malate synthase A [Thermoanaerobaculia bacterium]